MKKINFSTRFVLALFVLILLVSTRSTGQTKPFDSFPSFRARVPGNWTDSSTWEISKNGTQGPWSNSSVYPDTAYSIEIGAGIAVFLTQDQRVLGSLVLSSDESGQNGGKLYLNDHTLTIDGMSGSMAQLIIATSFSDVFGDIPGSGKVAGSLSSGIVIGQNGEIPNLPMDQSDQFSNYLHRFINNGAAAYTDMLSISSAGGTVINNGNLNTNGFLILKSDANGSASVLPSGKKIDGTVTVEHYLPARRAWWSMAPSVVSTQSINAAWQEGVRRTSSTKVDPHPGFGMEIYNATQPGYDVSSPNSHTLMQWDGMRWGYVSSTYVSVNLKPAFALFNTGNRSTNSNQPATATTVRTTGSLVVGSNSTNYTGQTSAKKVLVGNVYACDVDILLVLSHCIGVNKNKFWVWDPYLGSTGDYVLVDHGVMTPSLTPSYVNAAAAMRLASGRAFFAIPNAPTVTITFMETDKVAATPSLGRGYNPEAVNSAQYELSIEQATLKAFGECTKIVDAPNTIKVYPNPVQNDLHIDKLDKPATFVFYDVAGKAVYSGITTGTINCSKLTAGTYSLVLKEISTVKKIVKF